MLYWIWFIGLSLLGWWFAFRQPQHAGTPQQDGAMSRSRVARWISYGALLLALLVSWDGIGRRVLAWLQAAVPQTGTDIHALTVATVIGALCVGWVVLPCWLVTRFSAAERDSA